MVWARSQTRRFQVRAWEFIRGTRAAREPAGIQFASGRELRESCSPACQPRGKSQAMAVKRSQVFCAVLGLGLGLLGLTTGCSTEVTNLTPRAVPPQPDSIYPFEVQWESPRRGSTSAKANAYVMVDAKLYPMSRVPRTVDRWEAAVPLPPGKAYVPYKFKFDFWYPGLGRTVLTNSDWSPEYRLVVPGSK